MIMRVITGAVLIILAMLAIWAQGLVLQIMLICLMLISMHEMFSALRNRGMKPVEWPAYLFSILSGLSIMAAGVVARLNMGSEATLYALTVCMMAAMISVILCGRVDYEAVAASILPMLYPGLLYVCMLMLTVIDGRMISTLATAMAVFVASMNDCFALLFGLLFGRHKLSPEISPKKTIEGSIGGLLASIGFGMLLPYAAQLIVTHVPAAAPYAAQLPPLWAFGILGLLIGALSQLGDLMASMVKRHCGIKDFGRIFPGHGGVMDRLDGILFSGAVCFIFFRLMGL